MIGLLLEGWPCGLSAGCGLALAGYGERRCFPHAQPVPRPPITRCAGCGKSALKLSRVPMGTVWTRLRPVQTTIVDPLKVEPWLICCGDGLQSAGAGGIAVYIFVLDWRMNRLSYGGGIVVLPNSKTYAVRWQGAVEVGRRYAKPYHRKLGMDRGIRSWWSLSKPLAAVRPGAQAVLTTLRCRDGKRQYYDLVGWMADNQVYGGHCGRFRHPVLGTAVC